MGLRDLVEERVKAKHRAREQANSLISTNTIPAVEDCPWCLIKAGEVHSNYCGNGERAKQIQDYGARGIILYPAPQYPNEISWEELVEWFR